jgi:hypothetical protein
MVFPSHSSFLFQDGTRLVQRLVASRPLNAILAERDCRIMGHAHKDLTDQYAEQLREDVKYRRKWCEKIGLGFVLPTNVSQLSQPSFGESDLKRIEETASCALSIHSSF